MLDNDQNDFVGLCQVLRNIIRSKHVKGIVVGYPLNEEGQGTRHCEFIEGFLERVAAQQVFRSVPITLVNEYNSSMMAKAQIMKMLQGDTQSEVQRALWALQQARGGPNDKLIGAATVE